MNNKFSVGLDIGTTKIVAMVGEKNQFNKVKVIGAGSNILIRDGGFDGIIIQNIYLENAL